tara:strand:+ start:1455 stop:1652 length:198 start_codon:yes stop_codon:yes gene_type:complete
MIVSKFVINAIATKLTKHFSLDKVMSYVFDDNELDVKMNEVEKRLNLLEKMAHLPKNIKCKCNKE